MNNTSAEISSTNIQIPKKETTLIVFDKSKKITYFGACKIEINTAEKYLFLKTNTAEKGLQEITSTFDRNFVQKENALCVMDDTAKQNFVIIFPQKEICDKVLNIINKAKFQHKALPKSDPSTDDYLFKSNFYVPILKEIRSKVNGYLELKTMILELVNNFKADERLTYLDMVFEISMLPTNSSSILDKADNNSVTSRFHEQRKACIKNNSTLNESLESNDATTAGSSRKRFRDNNTSDVSPETGTSFTTTKKSRLSIDPTSKNDIITANYEIVEYFNCGAVRKRLLIFTSNEKKRCYEFYYRNNGLWHQCKGCSAQKHYTEIKVISVENGKITFKFGINNEHICQPIQYFPDNYTIKELVSNETDAPFKNIIKQPYFKILEQNYAGKHIFVSAKLIENQSGEEYIELSDVKHVCI
uniref:Uncharacterized protein n=1 Tax=Panagrolaimus sp. ES5 TaxID=591445 RepID=A0AC34FBQ5_9BILA